MKYKVGDRVKIKSLDWYNDNKNQLGRANCGSKSYTIEMCFFCGKILTIQAIGLDFYLMEEDNLGYEFTDEMIECKVEEEIREVTDKYYWEMLGGKSTKEINLPDGYIFKDENGNVINATKIVLEKKKKEVILTQEQIDTMVHESCVLFCKHCGCGVPRETCTSLGTCKDHDEYRKCMRTYFEKHKE